MSSEAITRNDLTNILNEVLPPTPSEYRKLLWTNTQGAQTSYTVTADFSEYDEIEIVFDRAGDLITKRMGNSGSATFRIVWLNYIVERAVTISSNTMTIGNGGFYGSYNAGSLTAGSSYAVPTKIYGIKYERVAPPQEGFNMLVVTDSATQSVPVGSGTFYITPTIPSGYQALCVAGFAVQYAECSVNMCYWDGTRVVLQIRNNYTTTLNVAVSVFLLCCTSLT